MKGIGNSAQLDSTPCEPEIPPVHQCPPLHRKGDDCQIEPGEAEDFSAAIPFERVILVSAVGKVVLNPRLIPLIAFHVDDAQQLIAPVVVLVQAVEPLLRFLSDSDFVEPGPGRMNLDKIEVSVLGPFFHALSKNDSKNDSTNVHEKCQTGKMLIKTRGMAGEGK